MTDRGKYVVFAGILAVVTFTVAEVALRGLQYLQAGTRVTAFLPQHRETRFKLSPFLVFGPRLDWQIPGKRYPEHAYFNSQGFRTREIVGAKSPSEFRIIAIGGSTTEDVWTEDGLHWPLWLERELRGAGLAGVRVYNAGMSAYSSAHTLIRLAFDVLEYEPDMVIVMDNINDLTVNYHAAIAGTPVDAHYRVKFGGKRHTADIDESDVVVSRVAHSIRARLQGQREVTVPDTYDISAGRDYFRRNLTNTHALLSTRGVALVLLTMPSCSAEAVYRQVEFHGRRQFSDPLPSFARFQRDFASYNDVVRSVAQQRNAMLVDMARLFGADQQYFSDFVHYNAAGSQRFGTLLAGALAPAVRAQLARPAPAALR